MSSGFQWYAEWANYFRQH